MDPDQRNKIEVDRDLDPERGFKWIRPNAVDPDPKRWLNILFIDSPVLYLFVKETAKCNLILFCNKVSVDLVEPVEILQFSGEDSAFFVRF